MWVYMRDIIFYVADISAYRRDIPDYMLDILVYKHDISHAIVFHCHFAFSSGKLKEKGDLLRYETCVVECEWTESLCEERFS